jgi:hypothetical protein
MPVKADIGILLNKRGFDLSRLTRGDKYYWRNIPSVKEINLEDIKKGPVGIVLNNHANENVVELIIKLQKIIKLNFVIRLHPNSKIIFKKKNSKLSVSDKNETLEVFSNNIGLAICGNTQAQVKLIMNGVPVLQLAELDVLDYDLHKYIKDGIVPGIRTPEEFNFNDIISFYKSKKYLDALQNHIGLQGVERKPDLYDFIKESNI